MFDFSPCKDLRGSAKNSSNINISLQEQLLQEVDLPQRIVEVSTSKKRMCILDSISSPFRICGQIRKLCHM